jgi:DNA-binding NtrC family response regulator
MRVLFVDDEPAMGRSYRRAFHTEFDVTVAGGGLEALKLIEGAEFDVVVCDLWMPDLTGMDLYARIAIERPDLAARFVFATGSLGNPTVKAFMETVRNNRIVPKTLPMSELREIVLAFA